MDVLIKFGLTMPVNAENLFSIDKSLWVLSRVPIPEGPLSGLGREKLLPYAQKCLCIIHQKFPEATLVEHSHPRFYQFLDKGKPIFNRETKAARAFAEKLPPLELISLHDACCYIQAHPELWDTVDLLDFVESVRDGMSPRRFAPYAKTYPFIGQVLRG